MKPIIILALILAGLVAIVWIGLLVKPKSFTIPNLSPLDTRYMPIPPGIPAPVETYLHQVYGDQVPVIDSVVMTGQARIRPFGIWLPARFVFVHNTGRDYRHYIEATFYGIPFLRVNEGYVRGKSFFESPMGTYYNDPNTNQGANLALWAEGGWFPAIWVTDERAGWEGIDDQTARLLVPFENQTEAFTVRFDPTTGLVHSLEAMRFRDPGEGKPKILWITQNDLEKYLPGTRISSTGSATWQDQGKPWAVFMLEEIKTNLDVGEYILARGQ